MNQAASKQGDAESRTVSLSYRSASWYNAKTPPPDAEDLGKFLIFGAGVLVPVRRGGTR